MNKASHLRSLIIVMLTAMLILAFAAVSVSAEDTTINKKVKVMGMAFGNEVSETELPLSFDYRWIAAQDGSKYNNKLATFANLLSLDVYDTAYVNASDNTDMFNNTALHESLGFEDVQDIEVGEGVTVDTSDKTNLVLSHKLVTIDGKKYNVFFVVVVGTRDSIEWDSNFDMGSDTDAYYDQTGEHPEWTHKYNHKGFDVTCNRAKPVIDSYIAEHQSEGAENYMLLTGHSRGAALANILGTYYEKDKTINSRTYTFAGPNTVCVKNYGISKTKAKSYKTIFNFVNNDDVVSVIPPAEWGFERYGRDIKVTVGKNSKMVKLINSYRADGDTYFSADGITKIFSVVATGRDSLYKRKTATNQIYDNPETISNYIEYLGVEEDLEVLSAEDAEDYSYEYKTSYSTLFILKSLSKLLSYRLEPEKCVQVISSALTLCQLSNDTDQKNYESLFNNLLSKTAGMVAPHCVMSTYVMALMTTKLSDDSGSKSKDDNGGSSSDNGGSAGGNAGNVTEDTSIQKVQTGDENNPMAWIIIFGSSLIACIGCIELRRRARA